MASLLLLAACGACVWWLQRLRSDVDTLGEEVVTEIRRLREDVATLVEGASKHRVDQGKGKACDPSSSSFSFQS